MVKLQDAEEETKHVRVAADWMEQHYTATGIKFLQKAAVDNEQAYTDGDGNVETGFFQLDGKDSLVLKPFHKKQISGIRYSKDIDQWRGLVRTKGSANEFVALTKKWVKENIVLGFADLVKKRAENGLKGYLNLPEGAPGHHPNVEYHNQAPVVYYRQTLTQSDCIIKSTASAIRYMAEPVLASEVYTLLQAWKDWSVLYSRIWHVFNGRKGFCIRKTPKYFDPLNDSSGYWLCVIGLRGADGKQDHAIGIAGGWIFDANFKRGLVLSKESLDLCCSDDKGRQEFERVTRGWLVTRNKKGWKKGAE